MGIELHLGDCLDVLATLPAGSVDAVVTDPPYALAFMGQKWDNALPGVEVWEQVPCIGIEREPAYLEMARLRLASAQPPLPFPVAPAPEAGAQCQDEEATETTGETDR
jgi:DNA modification methylase